MAQVTIDIPDAVIPRIRDAFEYRYVTSRNLEPHEVPTIDLAFFKAWLADKVRKEVVQIEAEKARRELQIPAEPEVT